MSKPHKVHTDEKPEKENGTAFQQQKLAHFYSQKNPPSSIICLFIVAVCFLPIGAAIIVASDKIFEKDVRYDNIRSYTYNSCNEGAINYTTADGTSVSYGCRTRTTFTLDEKVSGPIYMYYRLKNFYQNYRPYAKSLSDDQFAGGDTVTESWLSDCSPYLHPGEDSGSISTTKVQINSSTNGAQAMNYASLFYSPCGAVPWSMFNDTLALYMVPNSSVVSALSASDNLTQKIPQAQVICDGGNFDSSAKYVGPYSSTNRCSKKSIAFDSDKDTRFKTIFKSTTVWSGFGYPDSSAVNTSDMWLRNGWYAGETGHKLPITTDEDFMVWVRIAGVNDFRKLYRRLDGDLDAGTYALEIVESYDVASFDGEKHLVLATVGWVGGKNYVLGALFISFGGASLILAVTFLIIYTCAKQEESRLSAASPALNK